MTKQNQNKQSCTDKCTDKERYSTHYTNECTDKCTDINNSVLGRAFGTNGKGSQDIRTPREEYDILDSEYAFDLDPCDSTSTPGWLGTKYRFNLNDGQDGLAESWEIAESVFINPPWNDIKRWVSKAIRELENDHVRTVVFFIPARVETKYFHQLLHTYLLDRWWFIPHRVTFEDHKGAYVIGMTVFVLHNRSMMYYRFGKGYDRDYCCPTDHKSPSKSHIDRFFQEDSA